MNVLGQESRLTMLMKLGKILTTSPQTSTISQSPASKELIEKGKNTVYYPIVSIVDEQKHDTSRPNALGTSFVQSHGNPDDMSDIIFCSVHTSMDRSEVSM